MRAYIINLARSSDRRKYILSEVRKCSVEYELVTGIDGRGADENDRGILTESLRSCSWYRPGVLGCALSHLTVYEKIIADGLMHALVLEDDVRLPVALDSLCEEVAARMSGAEVVLLNYDSLTTSTMAHGRLQPLQDRRSLVDPVEVGQLLSTGAYMITREACQRMRKGLLPIRVAADGWGYFCEEGFLDRVRCVTPQAVLKNPRFGSTMQEGRKVMLNRMPLIRQALACRRQFIWYRLSRIEFVSQAGEEGM